MVFQFQMLKRLWGVVTWKEANSEEFGIKAVTLLVTELLIYSTSVNRTGWTAADIDKLAQLSLKVLSFPKRIRSGDRLGERGPIVTGKMSVVTLSNKLVAGTYPYPRSFKKAITMSQRENIAEDIINGIKGLKLQYFPVLKFRDSSYNDCVHWDERQVLVLVGGSDPNEERVALAERLSDDVKQNLSMTGLLFTSKVERLLGHVTTLPWMERVGIWQQDRHFYNCDIITFYLLTEFLYISLQFLLEIPKMLIIF